MLCTILRATHLQTLPQPVPKLSESIPGPIPLPAKDEQLEPVSSTEFPAEVSTSQPSTALQPALKPEHTWLLTEDLDEHIESFLSTSDRVRFSRTNHNFQNEMDYLCRRRLKLEYQSEPRPFQVYAKPENRKDIWVATDPKGQAYAKKQLDDRPFLLGKVTSGQCTLPKALQDLHNNSTKIDIFLSAGSTSKEAADRVKNFRKLIECGYLSIRECVQATGDASEAPIDSWLFESYLLYGYLDKGHLLDLTREDARLLTEPLVQGLIFGRRVITANQAVDMFPERLETLKDQLRDSLLSMSAP